MIAAVHLPFRRNFKHGMDIARIFLIEQNPITGVQDMDHGILP